MDIALYIIVVILILIVLAVVFFIANFFMLWLQALTSGARVTLWALIGMKIRKVDPMREIMKDVDVWITGLRRDQSKARANIQILEWDWKYQVLKFNPLASWSRKQIWEYVQANKVP